MVTLIDLDAYCERIEYDGPRGPTPSTLRELHRAHASHIPFDALDAYLGRPVPIDLPSVEAKLVGSARGGYCFEQNTLLAAALEQCGFEVDRLGARVQMGATDLRPRTHMCLAVTDRAGGRWLADVGFGGEGLFEPLPLEPGVAHHQGVWRYRITAGTDRLSLESYVEGHGRDGVSPGWLELYRFELKPEAGADREVANHFTATHLHSPFVQRPFAGIVGAEVRRTLFDHTFVERRFNERIERVLGDVDELRTVLAEQFGIVIATDQVWPSTAGFGTAGERPTPEHDGTGSNDEAFAFDEAAIPDIADVLLGRNAAYLASATVDAGAPASPRLRVAIVACMDARLDVVRVLGLHPGDAHVLRNAGGTVTDDVLRSLVVSQAMLGTEQIMLVHHSRCGMSGLDEEEVADTVERETGHRPPMDLLGFNVVDAAVHADMARLRDCPFLPHRNQVRGFVFDVETGSLREVR